MQLYQSLLTAGKAIHHCLCAIPISLFSSLIFVTFGSSPTSRSFPNSPVPPSPPDLPSMMTGNLAMWGQFFVVLALDFFCFRKGPDSLDACDDERLRQDDWEEAEDYTKKRASSIAFS
ncbi:hypothetical protein EV356DRAFT_111800 [Viridothelium virens]|uniref:Uncharacterized protein n=1 Tax=Viridothelium virens TaxID=1048519 RepID=A0A6A6HDJ3_VIRVR|nr:hypothetical protein EV356DRAFT_111800 [Viridothelium virens]